MSSLQKTDLVDLLAKSNSATRALLDEIDMELVVYEDPAWQVRDIFWHIAVWDRQVAKSIQAFNAGSEYAIPEFDEEGFNTAAFQDGRQLSPDQLLEECALARLDFQQAVESVPEDQFSSGFLYPWGDESGDVTRLVKDMLEHDAEHRSEIIAAANR